MHSPGRGAKKARAFSSRYSSSRAYNFVCTLNGLFLPPPSEETLSKVCALHLEEERVSLAHPPRKFFPSLLARPPSPTKGGAAKTPFSLPVVVLFAFAFSSFGNWSFLSLFLLLSPRHSCHTFPGRDRVLTHPPPPEKVCAKALLLVSHKKWWTIRLCVSFAAAGDIYWPAKKVVVW